MKKFFTVVITLVIIGMIVQIPFVRSLILSIMDIALVIATGVACIASFRGGRIILAIFLAALTWGFFKNIPFMMERIW